jgi:hypothetical protein
MVPQLLVIGRIRRCQRSVGLRCVPNGKSSAALLHACLAQTNRLASNKRKEDQHGAHVCSEKNNGYGELDSSWVAKWLFCRCDIKVCDRQDLRDDQRKEPKRVEKI